MSAPPSEISLNVNSSHRDNNFLFKAVFFLHYFHCSYCLPTVNMSFQIITSCKRGMLNSAQLLQLSKMADEFITKAMAENLKTMLGKLRFPETSPSITTGGKYKWVCPYEHLHSLPDLSSMDVCIDYLNELSNDVQDNFWDSTELFSESEHLSLAASYIKSHHPIWTSPPCTCLTKVSPPTSRKRKLPDWIAPSAPPPTKINPRDHQREMIISSSILFLFKFMLPEHDVSSVVLRVYNYEAWVQMMAKLKDVKKIWKWFGSSHHGIGVCIFKPQEIPTVNTRIGPLPAVGRCSMSSNYPAYLIINSIVSRLDETLSYTEKHHLRICVNAYQPDRAKSFVRDTFTCRPTPTFYL